MTLRTTSSNGLLFLAIARLIVLLRQAAAAGQPDPHGQGVAANAQNAVGAVGGTLGGGVKGVLDTAGNTVGTLGEGLTGTVRGVGDGVGSTVNAAGGMVTSGMGAAGGGLASAGRGLGGMVGFGDGKGAETGEEEESDEMKKLREFSNS